MRTFEHFNQVGPEVCPICGTNDDKEIVLIAISGTEDGNNVKAIQVHTDCLSESLVYSKTFSIIVAKADKRVY